MKIDDILYFAPKIKFSQVDWNGRKLANQFKARIEGFYLEPARKCAESEYAFAAGTLLVSCVDALARLRFGGNVKTRFTKFARKELQSFSRDNLAERFYEEFRNGLVHKARLKQGAQFSLGIGRTLKRFDGILVVNPEHLAGELSSALDSYGDLLRQNDTDRRELANRLKQDLSKDSTQLKNG